MKASQLLRRLAFGLAAALTTGAAAAQTTPAAPAAAAKPSPAATATGKIGNTDVTVNYSSPGVKGRKVFGGLEPFDKVWRAGANEATTVEFSTDVTVEGKPLPAGKYGFFVIPTATQQWTVIFNKVSNQWGAFDYNEKQDALRVKVTTKKAPVLTERLVYEVTPKGLVLRWENVEVPVMINGKAS